jgi:pimeloyl-ACP methyl ester carboxylesterase
MTRWIGRGLFGLFVLTLAAVLLTVRRDLPADEASARWARPPSKFVAVDGMRVHVRDQGTGPVVVLLHGANDSLFTWDGWVHELAGDHRVVTLDLPGHGLTGPHPEGRYSHADYAELVDHLMTALGVERFSLGGNSMGGQVAATYAILHPERVEKLIIVDATGLHREEPRPFVFRLFALPVVGSLFEVVTPRFVVAASVRDVFGDPAKVTDALIDRYHDLLLREGNRAATRTRATLPTEELAPVRLATLKMPVLILWGRKDRWVLPKYAERWRDAIAGAKLVWFDDLGHVPMEEDPVATARAAREFLSN